jgi:hypothetical protein
MKEEEIRPKEIFEEYLELARQDTIRFFSKAAIFPVNCPACDEPGEFAFRKSGFDYEQCPSCLTLFVSPRPEKKAFDLYYEDSPSTKFWATTFYKATEEARREKIWKPKSRLIKEKIEGRLKPESPIVDIGGGYGVFSEEMGKIWVGPIRVVEPSVHLSAVCREKGLDVLECFLENLQPAQLPTGQKCFVSFELVEHLQNPLQFFQTISDLMNENDLFVFTTLSGLGVDIQTLWEDSKSVSPPHHLNFFNPNSIKTLLARVGLSTIEVSTPGKLDMDIMSNNRELIKDRFWRNYLEWADSAALDEMQRFVSEHLLSSHMMVVATK